MARTQSRKSPKEEERLMRAHSCAAGEVAAESKPAACHVVELELVKLGHLVRPAIDGLAALQPYGLREFRGASKMANGPCCLHRTAW